ncbi:MULTISPECIES: hypothetical protein [Sinorhizobium/Ensifer group]|jgi:hypothetical protein|nr:MULTISPECIES: hypothetical protein [Sinorhizobium/Ensifer group]KSV85253.1 hypothetical protein N183_02095 [Sinorhizobium sp. Sb3]KSV95631.1 hypothetical protein N184_01400 [Sinorhizobium sp. GL28]MBD9506144.1 hypothetical protein [Ensifer sp. ENS10]MBV7516018.1 hypothetical protein [Ensifer sp. ENS12]MCK3775462.1 hypothetical protein [Ensifer sesbaniae]
MQTLANNQPASQQSKVPQSLLDRFENEWRAMRAAGESTPKPIQPAE